MSELTEQEVEEIINSVSVISEKTTKRPSFVKVMAPEILQLDKKTQKEIDKEKARSEDALIRSLNGSVSDPQILTIAANELAEEILALKLEREKLELTDRDITTASGRRVTALKALIDTALKLKELLRDAIDFGSPQMKIIMKLLFTKIDESLKQMGYGPQEIHSFFQVFQKNMESFQVEVQRLIDQELEG